MLQLSFRLIASCSMLLLATSLLAATYTLPDDVGSGPFSACSIVGSDINCGALSLANNDEIRLSRNITLNLSSLPARNNLLINENAPFELAINVGGSLSTGNDNIIWANVSVSGALTTGNDNIVIGSINVAGSAQLGNNFQQNGNIDVGGNLAFGNNNIISGSCTQLSGQVVNSCLGANLIAYFDFDEANWTINTPSIINKVTNNTQAYPIGRAEQGNGISCYGAAIPNFSSSQSDAIETNIDLNQVGEEGTISFWFQANQDWQGMGNKNLFDASEPLPAPQNKYFNLFKNDAGQLSFRFEDSPGDNDFSVTSSLPSNQIPSAGDWVFIATSWSFQSKSITLQVNEFRYSEIFNNMGNGGSTVAELLTLYLGDNRSDWGPDSSADGVFDEFRIFNRALSEDEVNLLQNIGANPCQLPAPVQEYRFDESIWNGTSGEVFDHSANALHGTANGSSIEDNGAICRAGDFSNSGYVTVPNLDTLRSTSTLSFWIKTPIGYSGNNTSWQAPAVAGIEQSGGSNDMFWGWIDANGRIGMTKGNTNNGKSVSSINNGQFNHVVLSWNHVNGSVQVYVNGVLETNSTTETGVVTNTFNTFARVNYTNNSTPNYLNAELDEILVFDEVLSAAQVRQIYDLQRANKNLDSSDRSCSAPLPTQCFSDNFNRSELGSDWAITSRGTRDYDPQIVNNRLRVTPSQTNVSTAATLFRLFPSAGNRVIVEFNHYAYDGGSNGGDGIAIVFSDSEITPQPGGYGGSLGYAQKGSISGFSGGWLGIGIDEYGNFINRNDGNKDEGFTSRRRETVSIRGSGSGTSGYRYIVANGLPVGNTSTLPASLNPPVQNSTGHRYRITIDNSNNAQAWVSVERDTGSGFIELIAPFDILAQTGQATVPEKLFLTITGSTGGATNNHEIGDFEVCADVIEPVNSIDHYQLERDFEQGLTCEPLNIVSRACLNADCSTLINGLISTTFSPTSGWQGGHVKTDYANESTFQFQQTVPGTYTLDITDSTPNIRPLSTEPVQCFVGAAKQADCDVEFVDAAYRFFASSAPTTAVTAYPMTAGQVLDNLLLRAVTTDPATGQCTTLLNTTPIDSEVGTACSNPNTCLAGQQVTWRQGTNYVLANPENQVTSSDTSTVPITFNNAGTATFALTAPDIGLQTLTVSTPIPDVDGNTSMQSITGSVNLQVSPASLELYNVRNSSNQAPSSNAFAKAGETFNAQLSALDINNNVVASSVRALDSQTINWATSTLSIPVGGVLGSVGSTGNASSGYSLTYSEVGSINLRARIDNFLGFGSSQISNSVVTGRFTPAYFTVVQNSVANWGDTLNAYQGREEALNNLTLTLQARDINGNVLENYSGSLVDFTMPPNPIEKMGLSSTGGALTSAGNWVLSNHTDFDGSLTLTANIDDLNWQRNLAGVTNADAPQTINRFNVSVNALTDADGICVKASDVGACQTSEFDIAQRTLFFARADLPSQVQATGTNAFIPVAIETLSGFNATEPLFTLQTTENTLGRTILQGLEHTNGVDVCTISVDCTTVANIADNTLTSLSSLGTTVLNGQGLLTISSASELNGMLQGTLQAPAWLSWDWDNDNSTAMTLDKTLILFGGYQGRPPVLFTTPGVR